MQKTILVTGGAGFIGCNLLKHFLEKYPEYKIVCYDVMTYASNPDVIEQLKEGYKNFVHVKEDIADPAAVRQTLEKYKVTDVIHLAAESHVDRSIVDPYIFEKTNSKGTLVLLTEAMNYWEKEFGTLVGHRFHHVSTDEVFGSLELDSEEKFSEDCKYFPSSPYSASKAASDHFVNAFHRTYGLETTITNCSNNYGPYQHKEKFIPTVINSILNNKQIPVYGDGKNVRDWIYVMDHVKAVDMVFHNGTPGETYCVGGVELDNITMIEMIMRSYCSIEKANLEELKKLITFVEDRKGHDRRYAICHDKISSELGWQPYFSLAEGLQWTIDYYLKEVKNDTTRQENS